MANYVFENITQSDANNFAGTDFLYFTSGSVGNLGVVDMPATVTTTALGSTTTLESITLTNNGKSLTFSQAALATATNTANHVVFLSTSDVLHVGGDSTGDTIADTFGTAGHGTAIFGFGGADVLSGGAGADTINGGEGNDTINGTSTTEGDYLLGGNGNDVISGGVGNDHIYGNLFTSVTGSVDGDDLINAGAGRDYVNGNAGNDTINGGDNDDRLYGGAGNDIIDGGNDQDYLQGNKGNDSLSGGNGIDELHGGADNDTLDGGANNDALFGDNGNDLIIGGAGYDKLTGGAGIDTFKFGVGEASNANLLTPTTDASHDVTDQIVDFVHGTDLINLGAVNFLAHTGAGATFTTVDAAQTYAEQLLDAHTGAGEVAAITVGSDTYLFFRDDAADITGATGATINSVIKLIGVTDTALGATTDFV